MKFTKKSKRFKVLLSLALVVTILTWSNTPVQAIQGADPTIHGSDPGIHGSDFTIRNSNSPIVQTNPTAQGCRPTVYTGQTIQIKNAYTYHHLNMWVTDANYLYNGCVVTPYNWYENDNTQWFKLETIGSAQNKNGVKRTEVLITSTNTRYALNIAYRGAGSSVVMYDRYLDTETWILEQFGENYAYSRFILKSNPSVSLHENPYTHQIYLDYIGSANASDVWYIADSSISLPNGFPY